MRLRSVSLALFLLSLWGLSLPRPALAASITFGFTGTVTASTGLGFLFGNDSFPGTPLQGTYTFDPNALDLDPAANAGLYEQSGGPFGLDVTIGSHHLVSDAVTPLLSIEIEDGPFGDRYGVESRVDDISPGSVARTFFLELLDANGTALNSDALLLAPPDLGAFTEATFEAEGWAGNFPGGQPIILVVRGTIDTFFLLPEPGATLLLFAASGLLLVRHRTASRRGPRAPEPPRL